MKNFTALACAALAAAYMNANAQAPTPEASTAAACPAATEVPVQSLYGRWRAEFSVAGVVRDSATLLFEPNPEFAGSVSGSVQRGASTAQVSGDAEDGEFALDESADGVSISATWIGSVVPERCGREIRGIWTDALQQLELDFVLRKLSENAR